MVIVKYCFEYCEIRFIYLFILSWQIVILNFVHFHVTTYEQLVVGEVLQNYFDFAPKLCHIIFKWFKIPVLFMRRQQGDKQICFLWLSSGQLQHNLYETSY